MDEPSNGKEEPHGLKRSDTAGLRLASRPWHRRFREQFAVLFYKNLLVNVRSYRATLLRLLSPLFFMFLLWLVNIAVKADNPNEPVFSNNPNPAQEPIAPIPDCTTDSFARTPCWDFFYTPNDAVGPWNDTVTAIVQGIQLYNPGRQIPESRVRGFGSMDEVNAWLLANPERTTAIVHFTEEDSGAVAYSLQTNSSIKFFKGNYQDPVFFSMVPLQGAVEREIARYYWNQTGNDVSAFSWSVSLSMFAHPTTTQLNIVGGAMGPFVFATNMFTFVMLLSAVVTEKELGLRQALRTMGMMDSAFWLSWMAVEVLAAVLFTLVLIGFGAAFQFDFFLVNNFFVVFFLFFLFQISMISVSFLFSTSISKGGSAVALGFVIFILGWIIQSTIAFGFPYTPDYISKVPVLTVIFTLMPWSMLAKGSLDLGQASMDGNDGISWSNRKSYCMDISDPTQQDQAYQAGVYQDFDCVFPLTTCYFVLLLEFIIYFLLAIYLDNIVGDANGVRKKPWYLFTRSYWFGAPAGRRRGRNAVQTIRGVQHITPPIPRSAEGEEEVDQDVLSEEQRMKDLLNHRTGSSSALALQADTANAVEVYGLQKVFRAHNSILCCIPKCGKARKRDFWAVKGSWFAIEKGRLFCLLGPNGAGKTTTINCLTGVLPPSGGDALVYGESLSTPGGMDRIRSLMGVCPQFDVLWGELSGQEHLWIYGRIKGIPKADLGRQAGDLLEQVKLTSAAKLRTGAYSGGMRRRLSVALALLGDPLLVYLDEPTTGMDPISRRHVWDIIERAKAGRAIVLTTHSMEEADILADTVAIMARGRIRGIGSTLRLKQRFGSGYQLAVSVLPPATTVHVDPELLAQRSHAVRAFFKEGLDVVPVTETRAYMQFLVPKDREERLHGFLAELEARRRELGVTDVQISLTSLEEVFLNIARKAELEAAAAEGRSSVQVLLDDGGVLEVPLGDETAVDTASGVRYSIKWGQDEAGNLQVLRWAPLNGGEAPAAALNGGGAAAVAAPGAVEMARQ